jgi:hypothetical protein
MLLRHPRIGVPEAGGDDLQRRAGHDKVRGISMSRDVERRGRQDVGPCARIVQWMRCCEAPHGS